MADAAEMTNPFTRPETLPEVKGGLTPYLTVDGAMKAADFYVRAFGAQIAAALPTDEKGRSCHVHLYVNGSSLMLSDHFPEYCPEPAAAPAGFNLTLQVGDIDAAVARAEAAGATVTMPIAEMFWGARYAQVRDPFGVVWAFNQPL
ncbi:VOC family protein [Xanthobacter sp. AM11]|uniref:VOC family protein n=1 Tax=Xanthobacter sp. AM11 TaxID=3380643 RepID=UPI0039BF4BC1